MRREATSNKTELLVGRLPGIDMVYARLHSRIDGVWFYNEYVYTEQ